MVEEEGLDEYVMQELDLADDALPAAERNNEWREIVTREREGEVDIALVGKYDLEDAYMSVNEALKHAGLAKGVNVNVQWVDSDEMVDGSGNGVHRRRLESADGIVVPGGFGSRGTEGKIRAIQYAREHDVPFLGLCLGFQMAVVEVARNVLGYEDAHSAEMDEETNNPVIDILPEQYEVSDMGGTMRLGAHQTDITPGTLAQEVYGGSSCTERHRHRYEVNPNYFEDFAETDLVFSGRAGNRMEILELEDHPYFFGTQFHPEFRSRPDRASPPFVGLIETVMEQTGVDGAEDAAEATEVEA
jgi:CTP synthase